MRFFSGFTERFVAGAIFGLYTAQLLYYLNPQIDISAPRFAGVIVLYGLIGGILWGGLLQIGSALRRRFSHDAPQGTGVGLIALAAVASAALYAYHYAIFRIYLPYGAVGILAKACVMITGVALVLVLLWFPARFAERRPRIAYLLLFVIVTGSSVFLYERRNHYAIETRDAVVVDLGSVDPEQQMIVVALRGVTYDWIVKLKGEGELPFIGQSVDTSYFARVEPFLTTHPKALWASLVTGKLPYRHGVTGRFSYVSALNAPEDPFLLLPRGVGFRHWGLLPPRREIDSQLPTGETLPFWSIADRVGLRAAVLNWPESVAARATATINIPDAVFRNGPPAGSDGAWKNLRDARPRDLPIEAEGLPPRREASMQRAIRADFWALNVADRTATSHLAVTAVALQAIDRGVDLYEVSSNELPAATTDAGKMIRAYLRAVDSRLERMARAEPHARFVIMSPSAAHPPEIPQNVGDVIGAVRHLINPGARDGFLIIRGAGVAANRSSTAVQIVDVAPTLLYAAGLPIARDMDGRPILEAFAPVKGDRRLLAYIQTYEARTIVARGNRSGTR